MSSVRGAKKREARQSRIVVRDGKKGQTNHKNLHPRVKINVINCCKYCHFINLLLLVLWICHIHNIFAVKILHNVLIFMSDG